MFRAVDDVTLSIEQGELFFLLGPSGCGKTTLLRMIAGFIEPSTGRIMFGSAEGVRDVTHLAPEKRNTGMVFQSYALWPHMTVAQNVSFGLEVRGIAAAERSRRVHEALARVQMEGLANRKPNQLSGGQQQRVALARALVIRPQVLLLDEPLSNLDAKLRLELRSEIRRVCKESGITTLYVTHDQHEALSMADRIAIMNKGRAVQIGSPTALYRTPESRFVAEFLGETNVATATVRAINDRGVTIETAFGTLLARTALPAGASVGSQIQVSVRPEAIRLGEPVSGSISASPSGRTYLGSTMQVNLALGAGTQWQATVLNPSMHASTHAVVGLDISPEDVVMFHVEHDHT
jgi:iron(III) transport system ATP-binding protein